MRIKISIEKAVWPTIIGNCKIEVILTTWDSIEIRGWEEEAHGYAGGVVVVDKKWEAKIVILSRLRRLTLRGELSSIFDI